jgi:hypothetical protein
MGCIEVLSMGGANFVDEIECETIAVELDKDDE